MRPNSCQWQFFFISISFVSIFQHYITIIQYWSLNLKKNVTMTEKEIAKIKEKELTVLGPSWPKLFLKFIILSRK